MDFKIVALEATTVAGYLIQTTMTEVATNNPIPAFWASLADKGDFCYGVCDMQSMEDMNYIVARCGRDKAELAEGMVEFTIPAGEWLVQEIPLAEIGISYGKANEWMEQNGYTWAHGASFEKYDERMSTKGLLDLYVPIIKK